MKLKHFLFAAAAILPLFASCKQEEVLDALIKVEPAVLTIESAASVQTVNVTAGRDWTVAAKPDWVEVTPSNGKASGSAQAVSLTIAANSGNNREGSVTFSIGLMKANLKITQKGEAGELLPGSGTKEDPYTVMGAIAYVQTLGADVESPDGIYVKGIIDKVETTFEASGTYGNASFDMVDFEGSTEKFKAFQTYYLGNRKWKTGDKDVKAGDEVIICGKIYNFKGNTPETVGKGASHLYSLNGETVQEQTEITETTVAEFIKSDGATYYRLSGKVSGFKKGTNTTGKNYMQFDLTDATGTVLVYGFKDGEYDKWADKIKDGGTVVLTGTYEKYTDKSGNVKNEVMNTTIESFEEGQSQTEFEDVTVAEFISKADAVTAYRLTGVVSGFYTGKDKNNKDYMGFDLTDATGTVTVYGFQDGQFEEWSAKIKDGGTVKLHGTYQKYTDKSGNVKHEVMNTVIEEFTEGAEQTEFEQITVAEFISKADKITYYDLAGKVSEFATSVKDNTNLMTFTLTDATGSIYVYSFADGVVDEWKDKIKDGGDITIRGLYSYYAAESKHEVIKAKVLSFAEDANYKYCMVDGEKNIKVKADVTEVKFKIKANAAWTIQAPDKIGFNSVNPASGDADAEVTVTLDPNTSETEDAVFELPLKCEAAGVNDMITITQAKVNTAGGGGTQYVLDGTAVAAAHAEAWSYTSGEKTITATDGSVWTCVNTYANKNQVTVQMNKGKSAYVLTPELPSGSEIKTISVVLNKKSDGSGEMGDRPLDILSADGNTTLLNDVTGQSLADGLAVASGHSQVRIICDETNGGAVYITSITVTF